MDAPSAQLILPSQCRAARGLLKWTQPRLAEASGIGLSTINRYENETRPPRKSGIQFIFENANGGVGVRLRKP